MLTWLTLLLPLAMTLQGEVAPGTYITAAEAAATLKDSIARSVVDQAMKSASVLGGQATVAMLHRNQAETGGLIHERATEIYYILEGSGTLSTGGTLSGTKPTDLTRVGAGPSISGTRQGGETRRVAKGDMIIVPAGTPHGFSQLDGPISYLVFRFDSTATKTTK
jgi:mannose-6-phosphate isomerase-like protein (cupin superfamily)